MKGLGILFGIVLLGLAGALLGASFAELILEEEVVEESLVPGGRLHAPPDVRITLSPGNIPALPDSARDVLRALGPRPPPAV